MQAELNTIRTSIPADIFCLPLPHTHTLLCLCPRDPVKDDQHQYNPIHPKALPTHTPVSKHTSSNVILSKCRSFENRPHYISCNQITGAEPPLNPTQRWKRSDAYAWPFFLFRCSETWVSVVCGKEMEAQNLLIKKTPMGIHESFDITNTKCSNNIERQDDSEAWKRDFGFGWDGEKLDVTTEQKISRVWDFGDQVMITSLEMDLHIQYIYNVTILHALHFTASQLS